MNEEIKNTIKECLNCKNPTCILGCPVHNNIPKFIELAKNNSIDEAYIELSKTTTLPSVCSLVCPSENQCKGHCIKNKINKPVNIPLIENYIALNANKVKPDIISNNKKVAVIGSGPAGLACAEKLAIKGYLVDIYDKYDEAGGILVYGIPDFVLNKTIVNEKIDFIKSLGVNFIFNKELEKDIFMDSLTKEYDAIFLGFGASIGKRMDAKNNNLKGIIDANDFLEKMYKNNTKEFENVKSCIVIGGGNTAIDAARVAKKQLNCDVSIVYRRSEAEMPARIDEIKRAKEDNISFNFLSNPIAYVGKDKVEEAECIKMRLVAEEGKRPRPVVIDNSNFFIKTDLVIEAISSSIDPNLTKMLETNSWGGIIVNDKLQTSIPKVFAGGDCVSGPSLVVLAMKDGILAANSIDEFLSGE